MQRENAIYKEVAGLSFSVVSPLKGYKTSLPSEQAGERQYSSILPDSPNCTLYQRKVDVKVLRNVLEIGHSWSWGDGSVGLALAVKVFTPDFKSPSMEKARYDHVRRLSQQ